MTWIITSSDIHYITYIFYLEKIRKYMWVSRDGQKLKKKEITKSFFKKYSILVVLRNNTLIQMLYSSNYHKRQSHSVSRSLKYISEANKENPKKPNVIAW